MPSLGAGLCTHSVEYRAQGERDEMTRVADLPLTRGDLAHPEGTLVAVAAYL